MPTTSASRASQRAADPITTCPIVRLLGTLTTVPRPPDPGGAPAAGVPRESGKETGPSFIRRSGGRRSADVIRPRNPRRLLAVAVALLGTALVAGACGSSSDGGDASKSTTKTTSATGGNAVEIKDFSYKPPDLKVKVGTKVTFTNKDGFAHTVTANDKSFDSKNLASDATFEQTFDKPGTFKYFCAIHNSMTGTVTVS